ncbi:hypothetical protein SS50377_24197 [Spironucleus salmonicida]|uniref:Myb-like DNA-binding domain-containing protein n=1 Tax=Spironucleus salmonicida TaxID=348837 RepID=V6LI51_9EUKA|nr:hypothetical protein SS50377_24197 [Spironucleus salmonicida]|eukprot:EST44250.1 Hypothetical protein SS50377_15911 [Spironucleus salmonicida]
MPKEIWSFDKIEELANAVKIYQTNFKDIKINVFKNLSETQIRNAYYKLKREDPGLFDFQPFKKVHRLQFNYSEADVSFDIDFMTNIQI